MRVTLFLSKPYHTPETKDMRTDRLKLLANHLETVPEHKFDMSTWHRPDPECGTAGCAFGHACFVEQFKDDGLHIEGNAPSVEINGLMYSGFPAAERFFGLTYDQVRNLFAFECYPSIPRTTPAKVAARIRELIASAA